MNIVKEIFSKNEKCLFWKKKFKHEHMYNIYRSHKYVCSNMYIKYKDLCLHKSVQIPNKLKQSLHFTLVLTGHSLR